jgi:hypothetical protein
MVKNGKQPALAIAPTTPPCTLPARVLRPRVHVPPLPPKSSTREKRSLAGGDADPSPKPAKSLKTKKGTPSSVLSILDGSHKIAFSPQLMIRPLHTTFMNITPSLTPNPSIRLIFILMAGIVSRVTIAAHIAHIFPTFPLCLTLIARLMLPLSIRATISPSRILTIGQDGLTPNLLPPLPSLHTPRNRVPQS